MSRIRVCFTSLASMSLAAVASLGCSSTPGVAENTDGSASPSQAQACADLAHAHCTLLETCSSTRMQIVYGDEPTCEAAMVTSCANGLRAPETGQNAERVEACAQETPGWVCDAMLNGLDVPESCGVAAGANANGAGCAFSSQCSSGFCAIARNANCGKCAPAPTAGDSCANLTSCGTGMQCTTDTITCEPPAPSGAACGKGLPCGTGLSCVGAGDASGARGSCRAAGVTVGLACDPALATGAGCSGVAGLACDTATKLCVPRGLAVSGAPCGAASSQLSVCISGGVCVTGDGGAGSCVAAARTGQACNASTDVLAGPRCAPPDRCVGPQSGAVGMTIVAAQGVCQTPTASVCD